MTKNSGSNTVQQGQQKTGACSCCGTKVRVRLLGTCFVIDEHHVPGTGVRCEGSSMAPQVMFDEESKQIANNIEDDFNDGEKWE